MKKETLFVAFSTQKGGVGKTTFTVLAASYLHYQGYNVAVLDCDFPQYSINAMRKRDTQQVETDDHYKLMAYSQFKLLNKKAYPIICSTPEDAIASTGSFLASSEIEFDVVFFDLPGTMNSVGI